MKKKRMIVLLAFLLSITLICICLVSASNPYEQIISKFGSGIEGMIISLIPVIVLLLFTYISARKGIRGFLMLQTLIWWIFAIYFTAKAGSFLAVYLKFNFLPKTIIDFFNTNIPSNSSEYLWFYISIFGNAIVSLIMAFNNKKIIKVMG
jgi:hypothetical protein